MVGIACADMVLLPERRLWRGEEADVPGAHCTWTGL
jgi:hypothetical protein